MLIDNREPVYKMLNNQALDGGLGHEKSTILIREMRGYILNKIMEKDVAALNAVADIIDDTCLNHSTTYLSPGGEDENTNYIFGGMTGEAYRQQMEELRALAINATLKMRKETIESLYNRAAVNKRAQKVLSRNNGQPSMKTNYRDRLRERMEKFNSLKDAFYGEPSKFKDITEFDNAYAVERVEKFLSGVVYDLVDPNNRIMELNGWLFEA